MDVRRLGPGDEDVVGFLAAENARFDDETERATKPPPTDESARELLNSVDDHLLVAFEGDVPIGFLLAHGLLRRDGGGRTFFIYELGVRGDRRRQGVGRRLLEEAFRLCRERGIARAFVITEEDNEPAKGLYRSVGGVREAISDVVYRFRL